MNYNLMAKLMPLMMNKIIFDYLKSDGIKVDFAFKKKRRPFDALSYRNDIKSIFFNQPFTFLNRLIIGNIGHETCGNITHP